MGKLRKIGKKLRKGIKKLGRKIGKAFKSILKPFAKVFNKFGPLGSMAMMFILPGLGTAIAGWGAGWVTSTLGQFAGHAVKFVGNAINFVATAPQKIFQTITGGISSAWNSLLGRDPTGGTWLSGTGTYTDTTGLIGKELVQAEAANAAAPGSWWQSFTNDMKNTWGNRGVVGADNLFTATSGTGGNFFDVSKIGVEANKKLATQWSGPQGFKEDIKNLFSRDPRKAMTEATAESTFGKNSTEFADFMKNSGNTDYVLDRTGFFGNIRDVVGGTGSKIGDITVPGVGDVSDVASVSSMAMGAYSTLSQYGVVGSDDPVRGGSGMGLRAEEQLYAGDQGGIYNISAPTWSYDSSASTLQNQNNAMSAWNNNYGFPQGFDPNATPGFGFGYQQWLQQQMAA